MNTQILPTVEYEPKDYCVHIKTPEGATEVHFCKAVTPSEAQHLFYNYHGRITAVFPYNQAF
jgi:hypothetical protein